MHDTYMSAEMTEIHRNKQVFTYANMARLILRLILNNNTINKEIMTFEIKDYD